MSERPKPDDLVGLYLSNLKPRLTKEQQSAALEQVVQARNSYRRLLLMNLISVRQALRLGKLALGRVRGALRAFYIPRRTGAQSLLASLGQGLPSLR